MNKIILKTALLTLAALVIAASAVFSLWIVCSPQTMATSCEKTGNYSLAVTCADLRYKYTKDVYDLARCADDAILSCKDNLICEYGEKLVYDERFEEVCKNKDVSVPENGSVILFGYKSYVCGHTAAAKYRSGDTEKAVEIALKGGEFAFPKLVIEISSRGDKSAAESAINALSSLGETEETKALTEILKKI